MKKYFLLLVLFPVFIFAQQAKLNPKFQLAREYERNNDYDKALEIYEELYRSEPKNSLYFNELQDLYVRTGNYDKSIKIINDFLKVTPKDINLHGKLGDTYFKMGQREHAFRVWDAGLKINERNSISYRIISNFMIQNRAYDEAITVLERGRKLPGLNYVFSNEIAHLYAVTMQFEKSASEYCQFLLKHPNQLNGIQARILSYARREENTNQITKAIEEFYEEYPEDIIAMLLSHVYKNTNKYDQAYELDMMLDIKTGSNGQTIFKFAEEAFRNRAYKYASEAFKHIIDKSNNTALLPRSYLGYVNSKERELQNISDNKFKWIYSAETDTLLYSQYRELIKEYSEIQKLFRRADINAETNFRIGYIYFNKLQEPDKAIPCFQAAVTELKTSAFAKNSKEQLAIIYLQKGETDLSEKFLNELQGLRGIRPEEISRYKLLLSKIYFFRNNFDVSLKTLNELLDNIEDDTANDGIELTLLINSANKDSISLSEVASADYLFFQKNYSEAAGIYKNISETPGLFYLGDYCGIKYAESLLFRKEIPLAISALEKITKKEIAGIFADKALFLQGEIFQYAVHDYEKAKSTYRKLLEEYPASLYYDRCRENLLILDNNKERNNS